MKLPTVPTDIHFATLDDRPHDECGLVGISGASNAAELVFLGLYALQHRGQESAGIVSVQDGESRLHKGLGLVADVFDAARLGSLKGPVAVGHVRYSTAGGNRAKTPNRSRCATRRVTSRSRTTAT